MQNICPKCKTGIMYQHGFGSCNWSCGLCGYKEYRARPRVDLSSSGDRMRDISREFNEADRRAKQSLWELKQSSREYRRAAKAAREARRRAKVKSKPGLGTVIGIIFLLWLLSRLL